MEQPEPGRRGDAAEPGRSLPQERVFETRELFAQAREVIIVHNDERYRLRITAKDKLILTK